MHGKFAAGLVACLVCLFTGVVQAVSAEYYVMDNPKTEVQGHAWVYNTSAGSLLEIHVHTYQKNGDEYAGSTDVEGIVKFTGKENGRLSRQLQAINVLCLENGMGYPKQKRYLLPLYDKDGNYPRAAKKGSVADMSGELYGSWMIGDMVDKKEQEAIQPALTGLYRLQNREASREMPESIAVLFLHNTLFGYEDVMDSTSDACHYGNWSYKWEQERAVRYQGIDHSYKYYAICKMNHPDNAKTVVYGYYLVEKYGRLIYEACDDGSLKMLYNEA